MAERICSEALALVGDVRTGDVPYVLVRTYAECRQGVEITQIARSAVEVKGADYGRGPRGSVARLWLWSEMYMYTYVRHPMHRRRILCLNR